MGIQTSSINNGPVAGFKNKIINGNFDIWQRGVTSNTWVAPITRFFMADRWVSYVGGTGGAGALTRQAFAVGQSDVPNSPTYFLRLNVTSAASGQTTGSNYLEQRIEDVTTLSGKQVTVSFWARGSGTLPGVFLAQTFGTGGSAQVTTTLASNVVLSGGTTGAWTKYTYTTTLPSVSGKTVGTYASTAGPWLNLTFQLPLNAIYQIDLAQVQVEEGPVATTFESRPPATEWNLCERYFMKMFDGMYIPANSNGAISTFSTPYRAQPARSITTGNVSYPSVSYASAANISCTAAGNYGVQTQFQATQAGYAGVNYADVTIDAEF